MEEMIGSLILYALMLFFVIISVGRWKNFSGLLSKLGIKKSNFPKELATAAVFFFILFAVSVIVEMVMTGAGFSEDAQQVGNILKHSNPLELLIVLSVASFVEEFFFRGYLQRKTGLLFAAFVFGYFHIIYGSLSEMVGAFFLGIVLGIEYNKTKNLIAPILSHFFYNLAIMLLVFGL
jgi:hypothetical protein